MDVSAYGAFEHRGWQRVAQPYHAYFGNLTIQSHNALLDALDVRRGVRFLDVASGPGYLAAAAAQRGADVVGVDFADSMVDQARRIYPSLMFRIARAEDLPFDDESADAIGIGFGMLHFAHPEKALEEAFRVLKPGGKIGFTNWATPDRAVGFGIVLNAIESHGRMNVQVPSGPPFFRFSEWAECERVLAGAGFRDTQIREVPQTLRASSPDALFDTLMRGGVRVSAILNAQTQEELALIQQTIHEETSRYVSEGEVRIPMPCVLAWAAKP
jgi:SAM-dependent methyltransferase